MAQQLHFLGEKVAMVALFDTQGPEWLKPLPVNAQVSRHLANLLRLKPKRN
jgi:thioesterase domain-containing protein